MVWLLRYPVQNKLMKGGEMKVGKVVKAFVVPLMVAVSGAVFGYSVARTQAHKAVAADPAPSSFLRSELEFNGAGMKTTAGVATVTLAVAVSGLRTLKVI